MARASPSKEHSYIALISQKHEADALEEGVDENGRGTERHREN